MLLILTILVHASKRSNDGEISTGIQKKQKLNTNEGTNNETYEKNESNLSELQFTPNNNDLRLFNQQIDTFDNNLSQNEFGNTFERFDNFFESHNLQEEDLSFSIGTIFGNLIDSVNIPTNDEFSKQSNLELENDFMEKPSELSLSSSDDEIISKFLEKKSESTESSSIESKNESFSNDTNKIQKYGLQCENYKTQPENNELQPENYKLQSENNKFFCENHLEKLKNEFDNFLRKIPEETIIKMQSKIESAKKSQILTYLNYKIKDKNFNIHNFNGNLTNIREIIEPLEKKINISFRNIYYVFTGKYPIYKKIKNDIKFKKEVYEKNTDFLKKYIFYNKLFELKELEIKTDFHYFHRARLSDIFKEYEKLNKSYREDLKLNKISKLRNYNLLSKEIYQCNKKYMIEYMTVWLNSVLNNETNFLIVELFPEILIFLEHLKESISILKTYKKIILLISLLIFKFHLMIFDLKNELNFYNLITDSKLINLFILDMRLMMYNIGLMFLQPKLTIKLGVKAFLAYVRIVQPGTLKHFLIDDFLEINDLFYDEVFKNVQIVASKKRKNSKDKGPFEMYTFVNLPTKLVKFKYRKMESFEKAKLYLEWSGKENINVEVILNHKNYLTGRLRTFLLK